MFRVFDSLINERYLLSLETSTYLLSCMRINHTAILSSL